MILVELICPLEIATQLQRHAPPVCGAGVLAYVNFLKKSRTVQRFRRGDIFGDARPSVTLVDCTKTKANTGIEIIIIPPEGLFLQLGRRTTSKHLH